MKQTFLYKTFDWFLIGLSLSIAVLSFINLIYGFEYLSSYILRIVFAFVSASAFISLFVKNANGERFSRIFIIVALLIPGILILNKYLTDFVFYGANRLNLLLDPILFLKLILGMVLLYFSSKYSKRENSERIKDYGIVIISIGIFTICYVLIRTMETKFNSELIEYPIWKTIIKSMMGFGTIIFGIRIKNFKMKFINGLLLALILLFIFGMI